MGAPRAALPFGSLVLAHQRRLGQVQCPIVPAVDIRLAFPAAPLLLRQPEPVRAQATLATLEPRGRAVRDQPAAFAAAVDDFQR